MKNSEKTFLFLTRIVDSDDPVGGFTIRWIREFAKYGQVFVICQELGQHDLDKNIQIFSLGKEKRACRLQYFINFYRYFFPLLPKISTIFGHMCPIYLFLAWPAFFCGKKFYMWYSHKKSDISLRATLPLVKKVFSVVFPFPYRKIIRVNQSIDINFYKPLEKEKALETGFKKGFKGEKSQVLAGNAQVLMEDLSPETGNKKEKTIKILSLGRISRVKNLMPLVEMANYLGMKNIDFYLEFAGGTRNQEDVTYQRELEDAISENIRSRISFTPQINNEKTLEKYRKSHIFIDMMAYGSNKTILEAAACQLPVLMAGPWLKMDKKTADILVCPPKGRIMGDRIIKLSDPELRAEIGRKLQKTVIRDHSLAGLIKLLMKIMGKS